MRTSLSDRSVRATLLSVGMLITAIAIGIVARGGAAKLQAPVQSACFPQNMIDLRFAPTEPTGLAENYRSSLTFHEGGHVITRLLWERANATAAWEKEEAEYTVSFQLTGVAYRDGGDVLYVAGIQDDTCLDIIEKWTFAPLNGSVILRATRSPTTTPPVSPIGTAIPPLVLNPGIVGSGAYVSPSLRGTAHAPQRRVIYNGAAVGHIRSMSADPEGRFLVLQSNNTGDIYQLDLLGAGPYVPQLILTSAATPALASVRRMQVYDITAAGGRAYILSEPRNDQVFADAHWAIIKDTNNDGVFDAIEGFTASEWNASVYSDHATWHELIYATGFQLGG